MVIFLQVFGFSPDFAILGVIDNRQACHEEANLKYQINNESSTPTVLLMLVDILPRLLRSLGELHVLVECEVSICLYMFSKLHFHIL